MTFTVSEVAERLKISPHTIRFYAKSGLLDFVERDKRGVRRFKEEDFQKLFMISSLKRAGMTISRIREFIRLCEQGDETISQRLEIILAQRDAVESKITELQDALDVLKYKSWLYNAALTTDFKDWSALSAKMPPNIRKIKDRIRRLSDDMEQFYQNASK